MIMVGIMIGSGIFVTTGIMARHIPSAGLILLAWIAGGALTLAGAFTYAELGASFPEAGGQYVYLREAYGPLPGFLFGWVSFFVYMTGGIAGLAAAFAEYFGYFFPALANDQVFFAATINFFSRPYVFTLSVGQLVAVAVILVLSLFNFIGLVFGKTLQNIVTLAKIGALVALIVLGLSFARGAPVDLSIAPVNLSFSQVLTGFGIALIAVFWAFDGWNNINFVAGEMRNPERNLPLVLIIGTVGVTVLYALVNYVYLWVLPVNQMAGEGRVAEKVTSILLGGGSAAIISAAVLVSIFGSLNGSILAGPRIYYAMARDNLFFKRVARVHPRFRTPGLSSP